MRFGVCTGLENAELLAQAGYDYIEPALATTLRPELAPWDVAAASLIPETWNVLLPGDLKVVGGGADAARQARYLEAAFARAAALGGAVVVFGSGASRGTPEGFSVEAARRQLRQFLVLAGGAAERHGLTIAIEPLNTGECNAINSVGEALALVQESGQPAVGVLSDLYHITIEGQSYVETRQAGALLKHVHVAGAAGRRAPARADLPFLTEYFHALKDGEYAGRISVEAHWSDLAAQASETLETLRRAWDAA